MELDANTNLLLNLAMALVLRSGEEGMHGHARRLRFAGLAAVYGDPEGLDGVGEALRAMRPCAGDWSAARRFSLEGAIQWCEWLDAVKRGQRPAEVLDTIRLRAERALVELSQAGAS